MADELDLDLDDNNEEINRKDSRIKSLSDKVKTTAEERDALAKGKAEADAKAEAAQKDADFYKNFNTVSTKYQGASEYQDAIREKVMAGYDVEDAAVSVLNKEGKFVAPKVDLGSAAGGSASIGITDNVEKSAKEMTQDERRKILSDVIAKGGGF